ncbi:MAG: hypothetical protein RL217_183 [Pseudomonadota bacterium]|jgi:hypothetical protein
MTTKLNPQGTGLYYFAFTGMKGQPIFHSVFEYEYARLALAQLRSASLLAYVLDTHSIQCVLRVQNEPQDALHEIHNAFDNFHEKCWNKRRALLAEQATVLKVDERAYLVDLILQLHDWPRYSGKVADARLWPFSSDRYYRQNQPPAWLDTEAMLNLLAHSRRNRHQHYEQVMSQPIGNKLDLQNGNHPDIYALARPTFFQSEIAAAAAQTRSFAEVSRLFQDACTLVARHFSLTSADIQDKAQRRRFHQLMPLVVWLLRERNIPFDDIAKLTEEDETRLELWLRNLPADHSPHTRQKLLASW